MTYYRPPVPDFFWWGDVSPLSPAGFTPLFKSLLKLMLSWMQIYDNDKYGRYLPDFIAVLDILLNRLHLWKMARWLNG